MWTLQEDQLLVEAVKHNDARNWKAIANMIPGRTFSQCSQRWRRMQPRKLRLPWTKTEDRDVLDLVSKYGSNWSEIAKHVESRSGKQIRERFINKLNRDINRSKFTEEEDMKILKRWKELGPKWQQIAKESQGRSENMIKNRFYSHIKKKYLQNTEKTIIENNSNEIKDNFLEEFGQLETDFDKEKIKEKMIVDENLKNKRCFYEVFDSNEIFNFHTQNFEEEDLRSVKTHYDFLKKKKELLENTLLSLNEKINRFELRERVPEQ
jgi:myb proto-oncogene protein